jgi:hypothetical protein
MRSATRKSSIFAYHTCEEPENPGEEGGDWLTLQNAKSESISAYGTYPFALQPQLFGLGCLHVHVIAHPCHKPPNRTGDMLRVLPNGYGMPQQQLPRAQMEIPHHTAKTTRRSTCVTLRISCGRIGPASLISLSRSARFCSGVAAPPCARKPVVNSFKMSAATFCTFCWMCALQLPPTFGHGASTPCFISKARNCIEGACAQVR